MIENDKIRVSFFVNPKKTLEFGPAKIKLVGPDFRRSQWIALPLSIAERSNSHEQKEACGQEYSYRLFGSLVREVSGIEYEDLATGEVKDFNLEFVDEAKTIITKDCYNLLMTLITALPNALQQITDFYEANNRISSTEVSTEAKKKE